MQICRVEDVSIEGVVEGSVVHFHWVRFVAIPPTGMISASGLGISFSSFLLRIFAFTSAKLYFRNLHEIISF